MNIRDGDPRGSCHRLQQLRIRNEIGVVNERGHFGIAVADDRRPTLAVVRGQRQLAAFLVAVAARVGQPVSQLERWVAEGSGESVLQRVGFRVLAEIHHEPGHRRTHPPAQNEVERKGDGNRCDHDVVRPIERDGGICQPCSRGRDEHRSQRGACDEGRAPRAAVWA